MSNPFLSNEQIQKMAPAVFAPHAHERVSGKYTFIPSVQVIDSLRSAGWFPVRVQQARVRDLSRYGFQRHLLRLRRDDQKTLRIGDSIAELVLTNAHDGSAAYSLKAGLWRLVCSNGLTVSQSLFQSISVRHIGFQSEQILNASDKLIREVPRIADSVEAMRSVQLTSEERHAFAERALALRYSNQPAPIDPKLLLMPRRSEDRDPSLWVTFNVVQENLMRGGLAGVSATMRRTRTRAIQSITEDIRLNSALWELAENFRSSKGRAREALAAAA